MDVTTLKNLKPSEFEQAADGYRATGDMADAAKEEIERVIVSGMNKALQGEALEAAIGELGKLAANFHYTQTECALVSTALNGFAHDMDSARKKLLSALDDAEARGFTVNPDGSVSYPAAPPAAGAKEPHTGGSVSGATDPTAQAVGRQSANFDPNPYHGEALAIADRIAAALQEATEADNKWEPKIRALKADDDLTVSDRDWTDVKADTKGVAQAADSYLDSIKPPPKEGDAEDNALWWKDLSPEERAAYLSLHPEVVGALDGLPAVTRDDANRTVLAESHAKYQMELDSIPPEPEKKYTTINTINGPMKVHSDEWLAWRDKYEGRKNDLQSSVDGMKAIENRFDRTGVDGTPEAYLLGFDPVGKGDGKVILANGNPDTADHTAVYVPGTGTHLGGIDKDIVRGERLWAASTAQAPGQNISTITWFDYDAPRSAYPGDKGDAIPEAISDSYAEKGGPTLREFLYGNRMAHQAESGPNNFGHSTVIGHSYGSTVIGDAAKSGGLLDGPLAADDVVVAGSPGMQADHAGDLGIRKGHMWAMDGSGDDDFVTIGGRLVGLGDNATIPTDDSFGSTVMKTDGGNHGAYWDVDGSGNPSEALKNQARVIVGDYQGVTVER
ncbi:MULTISPECIES: alpha/beta hydrolase [Streptomyces]|uniref:Alpha/beta hydrolase n=1 Tax=Streptomyces lienomycini TaxID=284035 RepID=A0ABV9WP04_9ACTN|nr:MULTISPECIES: alpha/beta hydrolase [Streptomyces]